MSDNIDKSLLKTDSKIDVIEVPSTVTDKKMWSKAIFYHFVYSMIGMIIGILSLISGVYLFYIGITQGSEWEFNILGIKSTMSNAMPGTILFLIGFLIIRVSRYNIVLHKGEKKRKKARQIKGVNPLDF